jgi:2-phospho-L-lactate transferase/gluconeogenesis factor (CofD/UPF0052 family)
MLLLYEDTCVDGLWWAGDVQVVNEVTGAEVIIYGMGSLYTSICPTLILKGVGETIAASPAAKVLILNAFHDRETGGCESDPRSMSASDIVQVGFKRENANCIMDDIRIQ